MSRRVPKEVRAATALTSSYVVSSNFEFGGGTAPVLTGPKRMTVDVFYTRGAAGGYPSIMVQTYNGAAWKWVPVADGTTIVSATNTTSIHVGRGEWHLDGLLDSTATNPRDALGMPYTLGGGEVGARVWIKETGVAGTPGTASITITVEEE